MKGAKNILTVLIAQLFCIVFITGCDKESQHPVPNVRVDFTINLEMVYELNTVGGWQYFTGGYKGIVIYRESIDEYRAFDRACTHNISEQVVVNDPPIAECEDCGSSYLLLDGSVVNDPAKHPLKQYRTVLDYPYLYVMN